MIASALLNDPSELGPKARQFERIIPERESACEERSLSAQVQRRRSRSAQ